MYRHEWLWPYIEANVAIPEAGEVIGKVGEGNEEAREEESQARGLICQVKEPPLGFEQRAQNTILKLDCKNEVSYKLWGQS